jgi:FMN-dependent NADH-azoreductase
MPTLLHIDSSCSPAGISLSRQLTVDFAAHWAATHPGGQIVYRDVASKAVPYVGHAYAALGQRLERGGPIAHHDVADQLTNDDERAEWRLTAPLIEEVLDADVILLGVPMYNFSVPASLKAWIDRVTFPGVFIEPSSGAHRLADTEVVIVCTRGGAYGPGTPRHPFDFQEKYLRAWFTADLGIEDSKIHFLNAEMTRADDIPALNEFRDYGKRSLQAAQERVQILAGAPVPSEAMATTSGA